MRQRHVTFYFHHLWAGDSLSALLSSTVPHWGCTVSITHNLTREVKSSITLQQKILERTWRLAEGPQTGCSCSQLMLYFFYTYIFILLSQTGANGMCGQDFRIHHWLAEELTWAPCVTCQSCQAYVLHYSTGAVLPVTPQSSLLPNHELQAWGGGGG